MNRIRQGSTLLRVPNSGLVLFLYDPDHAAAIRLAGPSILGGFGEVDAVDPVLKKLAKKGRLVACELVQDDDLAVEVIVGPVLTEEEFDKTDLLEAQHAPISLPSGELRLESYDNLRLSDDTDPDAGDGAVFNIDAGEYGLSVCRRNPYAEAPWDGASVVLVLTPAEEAITVPQIAAMLRIERPMPVHESWIGQWRYVNGVFYGLIRFREPRQGFEVNLDPLAAEQLKLEAGALFSIAVREHQLELAAVYLGETVQEANRVREAVSNKKLESLHEAEWMRSDNSLEDHLGFHGSDGTGDLANVPIGRWMDVEVRLSGSVLREV